MFVRVQVRRDGAFGGSTMAVRDDSATRRKFHVQRTPGQQMRVNMRRAIVTSIHPTSDTLETAQSEAAVDDISGEEESGRHPRSSALFNTDQSQTYSRKSRPSKKSLITSSPARTRDVKTF